LAKVSLPRVACVERVRESLVETKKDYYGAQGILQCAEDVMVRAAYRAFAQRYHPDRFEGGPQEATRRTGFSAQSRTRARRAGETGRLPTRGNGGGTESPVCESLDASETEIRFNSRVRWARARPTKIALLRLVLLGHLITSCDKGSIHQLLLCEFPDLLASFSAPSMSDIQTADDDGHQHEQQYR
jgi:hypothetical protein